MHFGVNDYVPEIRSSENLSEDFFTEEQIRYPDPNNPKKTIIGHTGGKKTSSATQQIRYPDPNNPKRIIIGHTGGKKTSSATHISVPSHVFTGGRTSGNKHFMGMDERNVMRSAVYGEDHREPLGLQDMTNIHKQTLENHFNMSESEQIKAEKEAIERLHRAGHLDSKDTTDEGEKTDTVEHEHDEQGRSFEAASSKGVAGHAVYTQGHGDNQRHSIINTCSGQTRGCGGGIDIRKVINTKGEPKLDDKGKPVEQKSIDTSRGTCFAPKAETQYVGASVRRACHEQAKHDPAMTRDWILAHTHSLRNRANKADKKNKRFLFRPNVVDETDRSSRYVIKHLNAQRAKAGKPPIVGNSYGKTNELHDPANNWHVTFSNPGPKTKHGAEISENKTRDSNRVLNTISSTDKNNQDIKNDEGEKTPNKNSYLVTNMQRGGAMDKRFQGSVTHAKYWGIGREEKDLSQAEREEGDEGHFDGEGKPTTPDKAHYGHRTITGNDGVRRRYDYQKQHILHPRLVNVNGHDIPTDSRFQDENFLPPPSRRFKTKNRKIAGAILVTTPTTSTSKIQHHSVFTHDVNENHIDHATHHNGEYEIDKPEDQEKARGNEYDPPSPIIDPKKEADKKRNAIANAARPRIRITMNKKKSSKTSLPKKPSKEKWY